MSGKRILFWLAFLVFILAVAALMLKASYPGLKATVFHQASSP
jgi:hypothetical protein